MKTKPLALLACASIFLFFVNMVNYWNKPSNGKTFATTIGGAESIFSFLEPDQQCPAPVAGVDGKVYLPNQLFEMAFFNLKPDEPVYAISRLDQRKKTRIVRENGWWVVQDPNKEGFLPVVIDSSGKVITARVEAVYPQDSPWVRKDPDGTFWLKVK